MSESINVESVVRECSNIEKSIDELLYEIDKRNEVLLASMRTIEGKTLSDASREDLLLLSCELMGLNQLRELLIADLFAYIIEMRR